MIEGPEVGRGARAARAARTRRASLAWAVLAGIATTGCAARFDGRTYQGDGFTFAIGEPPATWRRLEVGHASLAFEDATSGHGGPGAVALLSENRRSCVWVIRNPGRELLGGRKGRHRLSAAGGLMQEKAEVVPSAVEARIAPHRLAQSEFGVRQLAGASVGERRVERGIRVRGIELRGPPEGGRGFARTTKLVEYDA